MKNLKRIILSKLAIHDIEIIHNYIYSKFGMPSAARNARDVIFGCLELLNEFPTLGTSIDRVNYKIIVGDYIVFYKINIDRTIRIKRVRHRLQNNNKLLNKHK